MRGCILAKTLITRSLIINNDSKGKQAEWNMWPTIVTKHNSNFTPLSYTNKISKQPAFR